MLFPIAVNLASAEVTKKFSLFLDLEFVVFCMGRGVSEHEENENLRRRVHSIRRSFRQIEFVVSSLLACLASCSLLISPVTCVESFSPVLVPVVGGLSVLKLVDEDCMKFLLLDLLNCRTCRNLLRKFWKNLIQDNVNLEMQPVVIARYASSISAVVPPHPSPCCT